jgi:hypothetical protein
MCVRLLKPYTWVHSPSYPTWARSVSSAYIEEAYLISASGLRFPRFCNSRRTNRYSGRGKVWRLKSLPYARDGRLPIVARKPSAVSGTSIRKPFICPSEFAGGLRTNPFKEFPRSSQPRYVHRDFVASLPGGSAIFHLGASCEW